MNRRPSAQAIREAGEVFAMGEIAAEQMTPRDLAEACFTPTGPPVDELEDRIRAERGLPPLDRAAKAS